MTGEKDEIAELVETRGLFGVTTPWRLSPLWKRPPKPETDASSRSFTAKSDPRANERLEDGAMDARSVDRKEKRLGFTGLPRMCELSHQPGDRRKTSAYGVVRASTLRRMRAIDPGMFKNHLKQLARSLEKELALRELSSQRQPDDRGAQRRPQGT